ncbi:NADH-quinone oxidoreductase subunit J [Leadbetterella sp. DM7]|uniref:NADH-quinone oxidoreductase subunit J family protein n=1 Tax=Leadbetterella sp. DM7 TaxID=3235085 RepID=UPI00349E8EB4
MTEQLFTDLVFWLFCLVTVGGAVYVLLSNHVLYAAYGLLVVFLGVAGIFVFAGAEFVSAAQVMIYVGGILVLLIFGIMLSSRRKARHDHLKVENAPRGTGVLIAGLLGAMLILLGSRLAFSGKPTGKWLAVKSLGFSLMTNYVVILEIIGMLLLMALIGATYLAKDDQ